MRFLVVLSLEFATLLATLAKRDHRSIRQEATWLLCQVIEQEAKAQARAYTTDVQDEERDYAAAQ
jgi:exonuclease V gamma subunit